MALSVGARLGPYEVVAPLGAGGMGEVYRARDTKLNRDVAIKVLLAPDGKWLAYTSTEVGNREEIFVQPFPPSAKYQISTEVAVRHCGRPTGRTSTTGPI